MHHRHWLWPLLAVSLSLAGARETEAQDQDPRSQSHKTIPIDRYGARLGDLLRNRVEQARQREELKKLVQDVVKEPSKFGLTEKDIQEFKSAGLLGDERRLPSLDDPRTQGLLKKIQDKRMQNDGVVDPGLQKRIEEGLKKLIEQHPEHRGGMPGGTTPPDAGHPPDDPQPFDKPPSTGPTQPGADPSQNPFPGDPGMIPPMPPAPSEPSDLDKWQQRLRKLVETDLEDSQVLREVGRDFGRLLLEKSDTTGVKPEGLVGKLPRVSDYVPLQDLINGGVSSNGMPSLPSLNKPKWSGGDLPTVGVPDLGRAESPNEGTWIGALYVVMALIALAVVWKYLACYRGQTAPAETPTWRLGPWPVSPGAVATRQDLVLAFEYLSLLLCGPAARAWNHRAIAAKIGRQSAVGSRQSAAARLAALYEQARYAPPNEPLPERELEGARRDLYLLAGVTTA